MDKRIPQMMRRMLVDARRLIELGHKRGGVSFVCYAIKQTEDKYKTRNNQGIESLPLGIVDSAGDLLRFWVMDLLDGSYTYQAWLRRHKHTEYASVESPDFAEKLRVSRLAWMDWMLQQDLKKVAARYQ